MKTILGLKEMRQNLASVATRVEKGASFTIVRRSKPLFKITPLFDEDSDWEAVADFTKIRKGGVSIDEILSRI